jgi:hypothetical protein
MKYVRLQCCGGLRRACVGDGTRFAFPSYGCYFGRLKGLLLVLDLTVAGRGAKGLPAIAAGDCAAWRGALCLTSPSTVAGWGG